MRLSEEQFEALRKWVEATAEHVACMQVGASSDYTYMAADDAEKAARNLLTGEDNE